MTLPCGMPRTTVHILDRPDEEHREILLGGLPADIDVTFGAELPSPARFEVLVAGRPSATQLDASDSLTTVVIPYAGLPPETRKLLLERPALTAFNLHHNAVVTAENALALLLAAAKVVIPMDGRLRKDHWSGRGEDNHAVLLAGKTALLIGYGAIGRRLGRLLAALDMEVMAVRRREGSVADGPAEVHLVADLDSLLPRARVVVVCTPLTEETRGMLDAERLALLPAGAVLVNVARGPVVEEEALYRALESGHLHSAGIDVWYRYPGRDGDPKHTPPSAYPFRDLPQVVMSPHRGGWLHEVEAHRMRHLAALLAALAGGEEPPHRVDVSAGY